MRKHHLSPRFRLIGRSITTGVSDSVTCGRPPNHHPRGAKAYTIMPFGRLSPVSETDDESLHAATTPGAASVASSELRPKPLNFSRPRPSDIPSSRNVHRDSTSTYSSSSSGGGSVHNISAFYQPPTPQDLPDEPRFSLESDRTGASTPSASSEFAWDDAVGGLRSKRQISELDARRAAGQNGSSVSSAGYTRSAHSGGSSQTATSNQPLIAELPGSEPTPRNNSTSTNGDHKMPPILKRISFDQQSERMSISSSRSGTNTAPSSRGGWEDGASHHTMSVNGEAGEGMDGVQKWTSSDHDISGLSEKKLAKLKKKGINPQLYMEMKAARGGKGKFVSPLAGNGFLG